MLKVVMQWCATKNALPRSGYSPTELKTSNLYNHAEGFKNEHPSDKNQNQLLFDQKSNSGECPANGEAPCVAHKYLRGMAIEPEKAQTRPKKCPAKNC